MPHANPTVLVIDDDSDLRASIGRLLRSIGLDVALYYGSLAFTLGLDEAGLKCGLPSGSGQSYSAFCTTSVACANASTLPT
jgi:FixJ family two-component response regulator